MQKLYLILLIKELTSSICEQKFDQQKPNIVAWLSQVCSAPATHHNATSNLLASLATV
jgi:hypothetical protein